MKRRMKREERRAKVGITLAIVISMLALVPSAHAGAIIIDHDCTNLSQIPDEWIERAKHLTIHYAHTSHGSQITSGVEKLESQDSTYSFARRVSVTEGLPPVEDPPALRMYDGNPPETYIQPDDYWYGHRGMDRTRAVADTGNYNLSMWSWCGQVSWASETYIQEYLDTINQFESEYPAMRFIYMTGHTDGTGETGNLNVRNNQIRDYCIANDKILFDFADIESYDPDGNYYLDRGVKDNCDYDSGNWADEWCAAHPGSDLCASCSCAHSKPLNCNLKGRAFWWMMARLAGWDGVLGDGTIYVNTSGWWIDPAQFNASSTPIQSAITNATDRTSIYVYNGSYRENVVVDRSLTLQGEGVDVVTVTAALASEHVFNVTADYVNISRFTATGATGSSKAGISLSGVHHCNVSYTNASGNDNGIYLTDSSYNLIYNNYFNNTNNAYDDGNNVWNITPRWGTNIIGGSWLGGNYWCDYAGDDADGDGLGDTALPYNSSGDIQQGGDWHPLVEITCGDVNGDGTVDMSDVIDLLYYVGYPGHYTICSKRAADVNCDEAIDMSDVRALLNYVGYPGQHELNCCNLFESIFQLGGDSFVSDGKKTLQLEMNPKEPKWMAKLEKGLRIVNTMNICDLNGRFVQFDM